MGYTKSKWDDPPMMRFLKLGIPLGLEMGCKMCKMTPHGWLMGWFPACLSVLALVFFQ